MANHSMNQEAGPASASAWERTQGRAVGGSLTIRGTCVSLAGYDLAVSGVPIVRGEFDERRGLSHSV
jgi:hypothetical protein